MWIFKDKPIHDSIQNIPEDAIGFLYKITNINSGKWYIGRKMLYKSITRQKAGKKIKSKVESDWKEYNSSSAELQEWIKNEGEDKFKKEILIFVTTKAAMTYGEEYLLYSTGSLFDPLNMNQNIRAKIYRKWFGKTPNLHSELKLILF